ncbi:MAG: helix-turn-helix transcriptional regulator [Clostridia bacterium]|nr:helix-turn-helix transcriptional regulator [Clostridia bacterium]
MLRLKSLREENKKTMAQVARDLGIPYTTYVNYEKGEREPNSETLILLADYFNCSIDYLIGWDKEYESFQEEMISDWNLLHKYLKERFDNDDEIELAHEIIENLPRLNKEGLKKLLERSDELTEVIKYCSEAELLYNKQFPPT